MYMVIVMLETFWKKNIHVEGSHHSFLNYRHLLFHFLLYFKQILIDTIDVNKNYKQRADQIESLDFLKTSPQFFYLREIAFLNT